MILGAIIEIGGTEIFASLGGLGTFIAAVVAAYVAARADRKSQGALQEIRITTNGRTDRLLAEVDRLQDLCTQHGIDYRAPSDETRE